LDLSSEEAVDKWIADFNQCGPREQSLVVECLGGLRRGDGDGYVVAIIVALIVVAGGAVVLILLVFCCCK